ncbi:membrane protein [Cohnella kolymensis]|uniref:Membrane protein n=1 Tax=Cohnella kolymensis TaxID=1590652 RepID=A0ABR5A3K3_9BACL|nr:ImmA/IrrE family metallo-endopeptidase [Cohnella kolymensis]KIL35125.1 membrane protein [Cohnella kolymensis]
MPLKKMLAEAEFANVPVVEHPFSSQRLKGLYVDGVITINSSVEHTTVEKACILAEELGHHYTTIGNILNQNNVVNRKQELRARSWAYERLVPLNGIVEASLAGVKGKHEIAEFLEVTEDFLVDAINRYKEKYGLYVIVDRYAIHFEPLFVLEIFE